MMSKILVFSFIGKGIAVYLSSAFGLIYCYGAMYAVSIAFGNEITSAISMNTGITMCAASQSMPGAAGIALELHCNFRIVGIFAWNNTGIKNSFS